MTSHCLLSRDLLFTAPPQPRPVRAADALESALSPQPASLTCTPHAQPSRGLSVQALVRDPGGLAVSPPSFLHPGVTVQGWLPSPRRAWWPLHPSYPGALASPERCAG